VTCEGTIYCPENMLCIPDLSHGLRFFNCNSPESTNFESIVHHARTTIAIKRVHLVSAIRVGGVKRLKALIGRATESRVTAEAEILSSTSHEVCEMRNGREIVRAYGSLRPIRLVVFFDSGKSNWKVLSIKKAYKRKILIEASGQSVEDDDAAFSVAPNLTLNAPGFGGSNIETLGWLAFGLVLQIAALVSPAIIMRRSQSPVSTYGCVCYTTGTVTIGLGLALWSRVSKVARLSWTLFQAPNKMSNAPRY
jgi:hypothetical protein